MQNNNILIWLPSPMGDAVLCTPALRAIRERFKDDRICLFANGTVRDILSPGQFNDTWLEQQNHNPFAIARILKKHKFTHAILLKNSFGSALSCFLAAIPARIGYTRQGRGVFLTDKLQPAKLVDGKFKPLSMIDYYLAIACFLGADTDKRDLELAVDTDNEQKLRADYPKISESKGPLVILVPGGAFGPSKCWFPERFAQTADSLIDNYNATVVISVSGEPVEKQIAEKICRLSKHELINLAFKPVTLGELKLLFSMSDLVISNDTGPKHIAIALKRKVITLFGPNNPAWTDTNYEKEIQIVGDVPCIGCGKPVCKKNEHLCMQAVTVEMVCDAAKKLLNDNGQI